MGECRSLKQNTLSGYMMSKICAADAVCRVDIATPAISRHPIAYAGDEQMLAILMFWAH